jgi:hypothetical protein
MKRSENGQLNRGLVEGLLFQVAYQLQKATHLSPAGMTSIALNSLLYILMRTAALSTQEPSRAAEF